jgi:hypothetical protein
MLVDVRLENKVTKLTILTANGLLFEEVNYLYICLHLNYKLYSIAAGNL